MDAMREDGQADWACFSLIFNDLNSCFGFSADAAFVRRTKSWLFAS